MIFENPAQLPQQFHNEESSYIIIRVSSRNQDAKQQKFASFAWIFCAFLRQFAPDLRRKIRKISFAFANFHRKILCARKFFSIEKSMCSRNFFMEFEIITNIII